MKRVVSLLVGLTLILSLVAPSAFALDGVWHEPYTIVETLRLSVEDDTQLRDLFTARYGSLATDECISNLISNRAVLYSVTLAQKYESDIDVSNVKLKKTSESSEVYAFSADLIALKSNENIAHVTGTIVMEKMPTGWIAKRISLNN